jgi:hypothetical protein
VKEEALDADKPECYEDDTNPDNFINEKAYSHWFPKTKEIVSYLNALL